MAETVNTLYPGTSAADVQRYAPVVNPDTGKPRTPSNDVSMDLFLKLMVAQLSNQDPMQPTDDKEFLSQMASISSLQQMTALNASFSAQQGYTMIGKEVLADIYDADTGKTTTISGIASAVVIQGGIAYVEIGDKFVPISSVRIVSSPGGNTLTDLMTNASNLIGKHVTAEWTETKSEIVDGKVQETQIPHTWEGVVERIISQPDGVYAVVKNADGDTMPINIAFINDIGTEPRPAVPGGGSSGTDDP